MDRSEKSIAGLALQAAGISRAARKSVLRMTHKTKASHVGSCLSVIDILSSAFVYKMVTNQTQQVDIILSKGHAAAALYAVLYEFKLLGDISLDEYCQDNSMIYGHVNHLASSEIQLSTGSLGHGMPFAVGVALAKKKKKKDGLTITVISDGECNEGTTWESALIANQFELGGLVVVIDRNMIQSLGFTEETIKLEPLKRKWESFGWDVVEVNGHDPEELIKQMNIFRPNPLCIIANTIKGKGVDYMENTVLWHYRAPDLKELESAISQVDIALKK